jgi:uncharacterized protein (DUF433 family)
MSRQDKAAEDSMSPEDARTHAEVRIIDRGRGPELPGTRITVYRIMDYLRENWPPSEIAADLEIGEEEVHTALDYIEQHRAEVEADYELILQRVNPPDGMKDTGSRATTLDELRLRVSGRRTGRGDRDRPIRQ